MPLDYLLLVLLIEAYCGITYTTCKYHHIGIIPREGVSCPMEPCLTFSNFANTSRDHLHSNTTLIFLSGNHSLASQLLITNISSFTMLANSTPTMSVVIVCEQLGKFTFNKVSQVHVEGLIFNGCGGNRVRKVEYLTVNSCNFWGLKDVKSALELINTTAYINSSSFGTYSMGSYKYIGLYKVTSGGAIVATQSNIKIMDSFFNKNKAEVGGAIFGDVGSNITLVSSIFIRNFVIGRHKCEGGVLYVQNGCNVTVHNCTFSRSDSLTNELCNGGVFSVSSSTLTIQRSFLTNNRANLGGILYAQQANITISNTAITDCFATFGGTMYTQLATLTISNSSFSNCVAREGAVIHASETIITIKCGSWFIGNLAVKRGGIMCVSASTLYIRDSEFINNAASAEVSYGGVLFVTGSAIFVSNSNFSDNSAGGNGGVIDASDCTIIINGSNFIKNMVGNDGGVMTVSGNAHVNVSKSKLNKNYAANVGGVIKTGLVKTELTINIHDSEISENKANSSGGVVSLKSDCYITITCSDFARNEAVNKMGGVLLAIYATIVIANSSNFISNKASKLGGVMYISHTNMTITGSMFLNNKAESGAVMKAEAETLVLIKDTTISNNSANKGVIYFTESFSEISSNVLLSNNTGSIFAYQSKVNFSSNITFDSCKAPLANIADFQEGGGVTAFQSDIAFTGGCSITNSYAKNGGAVHATESKLHIYNGTMKIVNNTANETGGGIYIYQSELNCQSHSRVLFSGNYATGKGGGIHAISSSITVDITRKLGGNYFGSLVHIVENRAEKGGGMCLEVNAKINIIRTLTDYYGTLDVYLLVFVRNFADYGGAVYVADDTNSGTCTSLSFKEHSRITECFLQTPALKNLEFYGKFLLTIRFDQNKASISGESLYGGLLDRCTVSPFANPTDSLHAIDGITYFKFFIGHLDLHEISSDPVQVCFCRHSVPDCHYQHPPMTVKKGEKFKLQLVAVDQVYHMVSAYIRSYLSSTEGGLGEDQLLQFANDNCTDLTFQVFSPNKSEELVLYAEGPCTNSKLSQKRLEIQFSPCSCPIGFQPIMVELSKCECECESLLLRYITGCDIQSQTITKEGNAWIGYVSDTINSSGYLIYPHCPFDYCILSHQTVEINLNKPNGADVQCAFDRSGTLCGSCTPDLSLSLGSSRCMSCTSQWPSLFLAIFMSAFLAGLALVALLLALNLTVAVGSLNGIILYVNIVATNYNTFLPFSAPNFLTVFIAWLNLEIGFDTCFYKTMDTYGKTLLQLVFPAYVIFLVVMVICISERFTFFARLISKKNPVATLATLILLSYAKLLRIITSALSFAILDYPDGSQKIVWLPDASIAYITGRHIVVFITAILILLAGIIYTALLFSWQWLLYHQNKKIFRWVRNQRLCLFLEPYHAPYTFKHRYWTGLLLLVRVVLYLISAVNVQNDPGINLVSTGIIMTFLLLLKAYHGMNGLVYKKWPVDVLETASYVNIILFCLVKLYVLESTDYNGHAILAYTSGSVLIALFLVVIFCHIYTEIFAKVTVWPRLIQNIQRRQTVILNENEISLVDNDQLQPANITHSVMDGFPGDEQPLTACALLSGEVENSERLATNEHSALIEL